MAKQTAKQRTVKRPAPSAKPSARGVASKKPVAKPAKKSARIVKPAARPVTVARSKRPAVTVKPIARTLKPASKKAPVLLKVASNPSRPAVKPILVPQATPAAKRSAAIAKSPSSPTKPAGAVVAKVATPTGLAPTSKLAAKPAAAPVKPTPATKAAVAKPAAVTGTPAVVAEPKPAGRPMLSQGPFVGSTLTKRGTFAPDKLAAPAPKLPRKRPEPIVAAAPLAPPPPAIATSDKAAKNRAGLSQRDLDFFRDLLFAKRRELTGDMTSMEREALREGSSDLSTLPVHMADQGTDAYEQEFTLGLVEKDRTLLRELNNALAKIQNGSYGICEGTGLPISKPRLEAQPWAKYSIEHARAMEKKQMTFRR